MHKENPTKRAFGLKQGIIALILIVLLVAFAVLFLKQPTRSVAAYCKVYKEENARLASAKGDTYSVTVFSHSSSDPGDFVSAFTRLEKVAPEEIQPDVKTLLQVFDKINKDRSQALSAGLSGLSSESQVKEWTSSHCQ